ncbi:MAG TPA: hypothetical protein VNA25_10420 [Phycisphaerae bacterium]|nr:hypothetical protein [Phycisphaerae bacterium]HUT58250.1 hypothetical protein [Phycisphaerae bacterium]
MKKVMILGVVFFGTVWGASEVFLGEALYATGFRYASVPLGVIALAVLSMARAYFPRRGTSTAIAACAALYKCLAMLTSLAGTPLFACHLLGIVTLGLAYDAALSILGSRHRSVCAAAAAYVGYATFALLITYVFRYQPWVSGGLMKVLKHVGISGTLTAVGGAVVAPLSHRLVDGLRRAAPRSFSLESRLAAGGIVAATAGLWVIGIAVPV